MGRIEQVVLCSDNGVIDVGSKDIPKRAARHLVLHFTEQLYGIYVRLLKLRRVTIFKRKLTLEKKIVGVTSLVSVSSRSINNYDVEVNLEPIQPRHDSINAVSN